MLVWLHKNSWRQPWETGVLADDYKTGEFSQYYFFGVQGYEEPQSLSRDKAFDHFKYFFFDGILLQLLS
ncbi:MAG: hypothetical protein R3B74_02890 [Nitrospirales bacterium]|nr:hypothetical protein [Nitrospirales bacterium]